MNKLLLTLTMILGIIPLTFGQSDQEKHLSLIYDFEGEDFEYNVKAMVGLNDSLYIISGTPDYNGMFFRIDRNGQGFEEIWKFDEVTRMPNSLIANDSIIYGTTRFSENGGGVLFQYSLIDHNLKVIKDFDIDDAQEIQIKYVTDSVFWLCSQISPVDEGSIFTINKDGSNFKKIYNNTSSETGQNPVDFVFYEDSIYIACFNGGGIPYVSNDGSTNSSGCFIRVNIDGSGYENIIQGSDSTGTQPSSLLIHDGKLIGLFGYSGSNAASGGRFFKSNLDGSSYEALGSLTDRAFTRLLLTDSLIYGMSSFNIFGLNPVNGEVRIFDDLLSNSDFGYDVVSSPAYLNDEVFFATLQGGPNRGGTILRWTNQAPEVIEEDSLVSNGRIVVTNNVAEINLKSIFSDPEGDKMTFFLDYDETKIQVTEENGNLNITSLVAGTNDITITVTDGWSGYNSTTISYSSENGSITSSNDLSSAPLLFPNPAHSTLNFNINNIELIEVLSLDGKLCFAKQMPNGYIDISSLKNGIYIVKIYTENESYSQKFLKQ
ncbi:T9SS type A sorting domain-containing protein [Flammeovirga agarivorans]|uniref:T9SS type A sorting domain-containing protein n=1 Tax=Flammeovirga agarivorans TaxID=2726742 RepID=A0A7X8SP62_9BACT|nr:T9SS type A sorting domain-containing protein [Flammeovirga agarivorans]NLR93838.1 T9SS type A sorting domain-containing protein [Flammeovirga agarivorans]